MRCRHEIVFTPKFKTECFASKLKSCQAVSDGKARIMFGKYKSDILNLTSLCSLGVNIMRIVGPEWTHYFGVSGTFLEHFVTFLDFFSTFCYIVGPF